MAEKGDGMDITHFVELWQFVSTSTAYKPSTYTRPFRYQTVCTLGNSLVRWSAEEGKSYLTVTLWQCLIKTCWVQF